ncbi:nuclear transport factor 2 family protein [Streptomyces sp. NPDC001743]|uniref:nuclear transport factor 2 family protein n=1 Tax=Streptomyces sp. NPDC001743 TaxID=3154397 RepID=UPI00332FBC18
MTTYATEPRLGTDPASLYVEVQQFYARQVRLLDDLRAEEFAATFTEDGVFAPSPGIPPAHGREAIAAALRAGHARRFGTEPVRCRHWHNMLRVDPGPDGALLTHYYTLMMVSRPWDPAPLIAPSSVVEDVLVYEDGELVTRERRVIPDHQSF